MKTFLLIELGLWVLGWAGVWFWHKRKKATGWPLYTVLGLLGLVTVHIAWLGNKVNSQAEPVWLKDAPAVRQVPIRIFSDDSVNAYSSSITIAVRDLNEDVGCTLFVEVADVPFDAAIRMDNGKPCDTPTLKVDETQDRAGASTWFCRDGVSDTQIKKPQADPEAAIQMMKHELGHVARLAHDPSGLMGKILDVNATRLSERDRNELRSRYCPKSGS